MKHIKRHVRAISPVLAVLMMIAVAIAGALLVYAWIMGYIDFSTERAGEAIQIPSVANDPANTDLLVYVQNIGEKAVQLDESECLYVDGILVECTISGVSVSDKLATIEKGETAMLRYSGGAVLPGVKIKIKVTTLLGTPAEKYAYPAGSVPAAPVLDHFEFDQISSPQTAGVPFRVRVRAVDQYGDPFRSYGGYNWIYSSGNIVSSMLQSWISGVWTFNATFTRSGNDVTIGTSNMSDPSINGTSNPFTVLSDVGWLDGWSNRKSHIIENATGAGTDYQVPIVVDYGSGVDGGDTVYLDGRCRPDFGDVRFTDDDGVTELDYWRESYTPSGNALFWVEVADNLSISDATVYIYYGNVAVSTTSNGEATFVEFEDFTGSTHSMSVYNQDTSIIEITHDTVNDRLQCEWKTVSTGTYRVSSAYWSAVSSGYAMRMNYYRETPSDPTANKHYYMYFGEDYTDDWPPGSDDDMAGYFVWTEGSSTWPLSRSTDRSSNGENKQGSGEYFITLDTWNVYEVAWASNSVSTYWNNTHQWSPSNATCIPDENLYPIVGGARGWGDTSSSSFAYWDWILVRKFVENEPAHGDWGEEENWFSS